MCRRDGRGVFGSRHRFTGEEFYRRHFVALRFHPVNVAASFRQTGVCCACVGFQETLISRGVRRRSVSTRKCGVQPLFPKLLAGFAILRAASFLSPRICYSIDDEINILYERTYIKWGKIFPLIRFID